MLVLAFSSLRLTVTLALTFRQHVLFAYYAQTMIFHSRIFNSKTIFSVEFKSQISRLIVTKSFKVNDCSMT